VIFSILETLKIWNNNTNRFLYVNLVPYLLDIVVPIHYRKLRNAEWNLVESRFVAKLGCWQGKLLSYGDQLCLSIQY
jgi:hypothetical protein